MALQSLLDRLFSRTTAGIKPGLERTEYLLDVVGNPHHHLPAIHVAGTNGKGSTCSMMASIFRSAGYKTGLYTSPHVRRFNERMRIDGADIDDETLATLAAPLLEEAERIGGTFFEITTVMALQWFAYHRVDVAILETGLGGRLDSTNVVTPLVSIITSIDFDHMEYLGTTLPQIAGEKAGIIKHGVPAVVAEPRAELRGVFEQRAAGVGAPIHFVDDSIQVDVDTFHPDLSMTVSALFDDRLEYYTTDLCGSHQARNMAAVLTALPLLSDTYQIAPVHIRDGLMHVRRNTGQGGRIQLLRNDPPLVIDVAHNPAGLAMLVTTLRQCGYSDRQWQVVFGAFADKDVPAMLKALQPAIGTLYACASASERAMPSADLVARAVEAGIPAVLDEGTPGAAVTEALSTGAPVLVCGSFSVIDEVLQALDLPA
jgi:dihydrofolate synthase / folylpolyglutamate synthase